jgi:hypothetical protein
MRRIVKETRGGLVLTGPRDCANAAAPAARPSQAVHDSDSARNLTGRTSGRAWESVASAGEVACDVPRTGAGRGSVKKIVRSHVGNGAVNGESVRKISQEAIAFPNIGVFEMPPQDRRQRAVCEAAHDASLF